MTPRALAYVSGPAAVAEVTGVPVRPSELGGASVHSTRSGLATMVARRRGGSFRGGRPTARFPAGTLRRAPSGNGVGRPGFARNARSSLTLCLPWRRAATTSAGSSLRSPTTASSSN